MKKNTATIRPGDDGPGGVVHPSFGRSGQEIGIREGMVEAVNGVAVCFTCQQVGHINRHCPMRMGKAVSDGLEVVRARQEDKRRREEDRNEFLSAVSEASADSPRVSPRSAVVEARSRAPPPGVADAKTKLPCFLAVKRRKEDSDALGVDLLGAEGEPSARASVETLEHSSSAAMVGLGAYASSSEDD
mmetsp:Transcript_49479/g.131318  ORF Transcript_49479/g.131318 Transcript_49479/m.131318 type:complete len:188 (-) Transcript_49479:12-575(-)